MQYLILNVMRFSRRDYLNDSGPFTSKNPIKLVYNQNASEVKVITNRMSKTFSLYTVYLMVLPNALSRKVLLLGLCSLWSCFPSTL